MSIHGVLPSNPTAKANASARRRNRERAAASAKSLTLDELYARDHGVCYRCRVPIPRSKATKDHLVPLSRGGRDTPSNSRLCCRSHNSAKGAKTVAEVDALQARPGLRRKPLTPKPKPLEERAAAARERSQAAGDLDPRDVYADTIQADELF